MSVEKTSAAPLEAGLLAKGLFSMCKSSPTSRATPGSRRATHPGPCIVRVGRQVGVHLGVIMPRQAGLEAPARGRHVLAQTCQVVAWYSFISVCVFQSYPDPSPESYLGHAHPSPRLLQRLDHLPKPPDMDALISGQLRVEARPEDVTLPHGNNIPLVIARLLGLRPTP